MKKVLFLLLLVAVLPAKSQDLYEALTAKDSKKVISLVESDNQLVNLKDNEGDIPLCTSIATGQTELSLYFIKKGANLDNQNMNGYTPLFWAALRGDSVIAEVLLSKGASINISTREGASPLHIAAERGKTGVVKVLLNHGAALELEDIRKRTPLHVAVRERGGLKTVKILVENGANINAVDHFGDTPLSLGAWRGFEDIVNYLLEKGVHISTTGKKGMALLTYAADKRLERLYKALIKEGGKSFQEAIKDKPVLHWAAAGGNINIIEDLIKRGYSVNEKDHFGWAPLHYAAYFGRLEAIGVLKEQGADINSRTNLGETPFYLATLENKKQTVDYLLAAGADETMKKHTNYKGSYWGQPFPGDQAEIFAPGIVSRLKGGHSTVTFSPDGKKAFWTEWQLTDVGYSGGCTVWYSSNENGTWSLPAIFLDEGDTPFFSPNGSKVFLKATLQDNDGQEKSGIWYYEFINGEISQPSYLDFNLREMGLYWQFSFDKDENIYFSTDEGLFRSKNENGKYKVKEKLSEIFHPDYKGSQPYISPQGDYLIFSSMSLDDCYGSMDLYIGFKRTDGTWTEPYNMGPKVNSSNIEILPIISPNGKFLFYRTERNGIFGIYWISTEVIDELRQKI